MQPGNLYDISISPIFFQVRSYTVVTYTLWDFHYICQTCINVYAHLRLVKLLRLAVALAYIFRCFHFYFSLNPVMRGIRIDRMVYAFKWA